MKEKKEIIFDNVIKPRHYNQYDIKPLLDGETIQPWDIMREVARTIPDSWQAHMTISLLGYLLRYQFKNGIEDLKKSRFYLNELIKYMEEKNVNK